MSRIIVILSCIFAFGIFISGVALQSKTLTNGDCYPPKLDHFDKTQIEYARVSGGCAVYVTPINKKNLVFRSYLFGDNGIFQIFNSYGPGDEKKMTGARVFVFFPRKRFVKYEILRSGNIRVSLPSGGKALIVAKTTRLYDLPGFKFKEAREIAPDNAGGVEIVRGRSLMMDAGYKTGDVPYAEPQGKVKFVDEDGLSCEVTNKDVFNYGSENISLKSDAKLYETLKEICPQLDINSLNP